MAAVLPRVWRIGQILRIFLTVHYLPFPPLPPFPPSPPEDVWGTSECIFRMHFPAREMESQPNGGQGVAEDGDWSEWWRTAYGVVAYTRRPGGGGVQPSPADR